MSSYVNGNLFAKEINHQLGQRFDSKEVTSIGNRLNGLYLSKRPEIVFSEKKDIIESVLISMADNKTKKIVKTSLVKDVFNADDVIRNIKDIYHETKAHNNRLLMNHMMEVAVKPNIPKPILKDPRVEIHEKLETPSIMIFYEESLIYLKDSDTNHKQLTLHIIGVPKKKIINHMGI